MLVARSMPWAVVAEAVAHAAEAEFRNGESPQLAGPHHVGLTAVAAALRGLRHSGSSQRGCTDWQCCASCGDAGGLQKSAPVGSQPRLSHGFHDR